MGSGTQHEYKTVCPGPPLVALRQNRYADRHAQACHMVVVELNRHKPAHAATWWPWDMACVWKQVNTCCHVVALVHGRQMFLQWLMVVLRHSRYVNSVLGTVLGHGRHATDL